MGLGVYSLEGQDKGGEMGQRSEPAGRRSGAAGQTGFGRYLRKIREDRKLSLDAVEERSFGFPGKVTKSHLSRIETGQAVPTFPRMFTLSRIYGVPIAQLAERFDLDLRAGLTDPADAAAPDRTDPADARGADARDADAEGAEGAGALERVHTWIRSGRYAEALQGADAALARMDPAAGGPVTVALRLARIDALLHLGGYHTAKDEAEELLNSDDLDAAQRVSTIYHLALSGYRLGRFHVAGFALEKAEQALQSLGADHRLHPMLHTLKGNLAVRLDRPQEAVEAFRRALHGYEHVDDAFEACRTRLNLTSALIQTGHPQEAKRQLVRIVERSRRQGWDRLAALALSNLALIAYTAGDHRAAESFCLQSNTIARSRDYMTVVFRNCFYLWKIARERGDDAAARTNFRTLKTYLGRLVDALPEADAFRAHLARSES